MSSMELTIIQKISAYALPILFAITVHEAAHGYVARYFGDMTAHYMNRISLNPLRHIDPVGTVIFPALTLLVGGILFGWAKPVPVNFSNLTNPKKDMFWVALAGPAANLVMAIFWTILLARINFFPQDAELFMRVMCLAGIQINIVLMVLNLLPIPPLDGGRIAVSVLPHPWSNYVAGLEKYGFFTLVKNLNGSHIGMLKAAIKFLFSKNSSEKFLYTYYGRTKFNVLKFMLSSFFQTYFRKRFINNNLEKNPKINSPFIYFPLGVDLEKNLLIDSPLYNNQIEIIRIIAKSIPINYELWIKESPGQMTRNWRSISDYKKIINLPNVRVFHPDCSNSELIQGSSLVITIAGSSGMEAAIYQKPAIVFSDTLYSHLSCVTRIREIENLSEEIKIALKKSVDVNEINKFLQTIEKNSVSFDLMKFYTSHTDTFFLNGSILDNHIDELKMSNYLKSNYQVIKNLGDEYLKQISLLSKNHC